MEEVVESGVVSFLRVKFSESFQWNHCRVRGNALIISKLFGAHKPSIIGFGFRAIYSLVPLRFNLLFTDITSI